MVIGLERFLDYFVGFEESYVIIGGTACDLLLEKAGLEFRSTKDLDIVLLLGPDSREFTKRLWDFLTKGDYRHWNKRDARPQFYRFSEPSTPGFPAMIELLGRSPLELPPGQTIGPIPTEEGFSSLSVILMDEAYYNLILSSRRIVGKAPVIEPSALILLKAKAYLSLSAEREKGQHVRSTDILKHRNDVFRLFRLLRPADRIDTNDALRSDLREFIEGFPKDASDWSAIRQAVSDPNLPTPSELLRQMRTIYQL
ncbi:MAG: hypothetical protein R6W82_10545 [bacterium]